MWEYKRKDIRFKHYSELIDNLNEEGNNNWEIIYYLEEKPEKYGNDFYAKALFKRIKSVQ